MGIVSRREEDLAGNLLYRGLLAYKIQLVELCPQRIPRTAVYSPSLYYAEMFS